MRRQRTLLLCQMLRGPGRTESCTRRPTVPTGRRRIPHRDTRRCDARESLFIASSVGLWRTLHTGETTYTATCPRRTRHLRRLKKFGHGDERRVRAHLHATSAEVVQVVRARHGDVITAELRFRARYRAQIRPRRTGMPLPLAQPPKSYLVPLETPPRCGRAAVCCR
jgi:hypothetical protein